MTRLVACTDCGARSYYASRRCPACGGRTEPVDEDLGVGVLVATTTVYVTPPGVRSPNPLGIARFDDVPVLAQLADGTLTVGDDVVLHDDDPLGETGEARGPRLHPGG